MSSVSSTGAVEVKVVTWNLWCMIFDSPRTLSNPWKCGSVVRRMGKRQRWNEFNGLIVVNLQELWGWKTGLIPGYIIHCLSWVEFIPCFIGRLLSWIIQFIALLLGILPILKCLPFQYTPQIWFAKRVAKYLPYYHYQSIVPWNRLIDNGLAMCFNRSPTATGGESFTDHYCEDALANKGFIWAYFQQYRLLIINTHLQAAGTGVERVQQLEQLNEFVKSKQWRNKMDRLIVTGDFNVDMRSLDERFERIERSKKSANHCEYSIYKASELHESMNLSDASNSQLGVKPAIKNEGMRSALSILNTATELSSVRRTLAAAHPTKNRSAPNVTYAPDMRRANSQSVASDDEKEMIDTPEPHSSVPPFRPEITSVESIAIEMELEVKTASQQTILKAPNPFPKNPTTNSDTDITTDDADSSKSDTNRPPLYGEYIDIPKTLGVHQITGFQSTMRKFDLNLDHIFTNFQIHPSQLTESVHARGGGLSDHVLIMAEFTAQ